MGASLHGGAQGWFTVHHSLSIGRFFEEAGQRESGFQPMGEGKKDSGHKRGRRGKRGRRLKGQR
jgi:hypothetical protein